MNNSPDQKTYETYNNGRFSNIEDWRRDNVNELVKDLNTAIKQEKSYVKFGISPFGVWRNIADDQTGSNTTAGQETLMIFMLIHVSGYKKVTLTTSHRKYIGILVSHPLHMTY